MEEEEGEGREEGEEEEERQRQTPGAESVGNLGPREGRAEAGAPFCLLPTCSFPTPFTYVPRGLVWAGLGRKVDDPQRYNIFRGRYFHRMFVGSCGNFFRDFRFLE